VGFFRSVSPTFCSRLRQHILIATLFFVTDGFVTGSVSLAVAATTTGSPIVAASAIRSDANTHSTRNSMGCLKTTQPLSDQGRIYFSNEQYLLATQQFSMAALLTCSEAEGLAARLRWAQSLFELDETAEGNRVLENLSGPSSMLSQAKILQAWYQPSLRETLPPELKPRFVKYNEAIANVNVPKVKEPWVAGTLSALLPGAGQAYVGNYQSAAFALALNVLFFSATKELYDRNLDSTGLAAGAIFSVVYIGNIVSAVQSSHSLNQKARDPFEKEVAQRLFPELSF
jgi:hypothetical protein